MSEREVTIGLLHLAPVVGDLAGNRAQIETSTIEAAEVGCDWVVSGELVATGYDFTPSLGTAWIEPQPDAWLVGYCSLVASLGVVAFVQVPERDAEAGTLHSTMFAIDRDGSIVGRHRKVAVIPGAESWALAGNDAMPVVVDGVRVGMLVCADAHPPGIADRHHELGVDLFVSSAAWAPGHHGPAGEWESISERTSRPVVVCNRSGQDVRLDFGCATSVVAVGGERVAELTSETSTVFVVSVGLR